jgi:hypothetical protein
VLAEEKMGAMGNCLAHFFCLMYTDDYLQGFALHPAIVSGTE